MNVSVGSRWEGFIETVVKEGRYGSASEVVRAGLRLVEEREAKLQELRNKLNASVAAGDPGSDDDLELLIAAKEAQLKKAGF